MTKPKQKTPEERLAVVDRYSWYIENALRTKLDGMSKSVKEARATLEKENDGSVPYRSLEGMCEHIEFAIRDFQEAYDALKEAGIR